MEAVFSPSIAFAPTVTPGTYLDPPSPQDPPAESMLFPPTADAPSSSRRAAHAKKKPENHIPRPPNAFILFRSSFIKNQHVSSEVETNHSTLSKIIGLTWQNLPHEERQIWHSKAKAALDEHKRKFPQYAFRPLHTKGKAAEKRKVREVGPKDLKRCEKIAELLVEGKKGAELDAAIAEFDRHHVPEIVTRFEAPITARSFRRSSSAPAPDTEHSNPPFLVATSASAKLRAMSSQPETSTSTPEPNATMGSLSDYESSESDGSLCTTPSSPYPTTPFTETNPSFDFSTFSFSSTSPTPIPSQCDPYGLPPIQTQFDGFNFSSQQSPLSCTSPSEMFSSMDVNLSQYSEFYDSFSSQMASMPGSPSDNQVIYSPMPHPAPRIAPSPSQFEYAFDFSRDTSSTVALSAFAHMAPDFALEYPSCSGGAPSSYEGDLAPSFAASVPTYAL